MAKKLGQNPTEAKTGARKKALLVLLAVGLCVGGAIPVFLISADSPEWEPRVAQVKVATPPPPAPAQVAPVKVAPPPPPSVPGGAPVTPSAPLTESPPSIEPSIRITKVKRLLRLAQKAYMAGDYADAIRSGRQVLKLNPNNASAWQVIGVAACYTKNMKQVKRAFGKLGLSRRNLVRQVCARNGIAL